MSLCECAYCQYLVEDNPEAVKDTVPPTDDEEGWKHLADEHAENCEWILTRAHQLDQPRSC
jgi:hypothetical protein